MGITVYSGTEISWIALNPTKTPMNVALDTIDKPTARKCVMNEQVKIPPSLPSSVSMGQGPVCSSFVIPIAPVITEIE